LRELREPREEPLSGQVQGLSLEKQLRMQAEREQHRVDIEHMRQIINEEKAKGRDKEREWEQRVAKLLKVIYTNIYMYVYLYESCICVVMCCVVYT
jgi:hypothetical protein